MARLIRSTSADLTSLTLAAALTLVAAEARAQDAKPPRDPAAAEALYKTGRDLLQKGDWAGACPKFDASMQLDPAASTLINVAKCRDHEGKLAGAWAELKRAKVLNLETQGDERRKTLDEVIDKSLADLEARLPKLNLTISPRPEGLSVTWDGTPIPLAMLDESIPFDPGPHVIRIEAPGHTPFEKTLTLVEGRTAAFDINLSPVAVTAPPSPAQAPPRARPIPAWPFVTGGFGLALVGAGVGFRIHAMGIEATLDEQCGEQRVCDPASGYDPADDNRQKNIDYGAFLGLTIGGGAALLATAIGVVVEVAIAPGDEQAKVAVVPLALPSGGGLAVGGQF